MNPKVFLWDQHSITNNKIIKHQFNFIDKNNNIINIKVNFWIIKFK